MNSFNASSIQTTTTTTTTTILRHTKSVMHEMRRKFFVSEFVRQNKDIEHSLSEIAVRKVFDFNSEQWEKIAGY